MATAIATDRQLWWLWRAVFQRRYSLTGKQEVRLVTPVSRKFRRETGELNGSLSGSARFTLLLTVFGKRSVFTAYKPY